MNHALLLPLVLLATILPSVSPAFAGDRPRSLMEQLEAIAPAAFRQGARSKRDVRFSRGPQSTYPQQIRVIPYRGS